MSETKEKIVKAAIAAFKRFGVDRTTMADIAKESGLSRQTLYSTLGSKDEILAESVGYNMRESLLKIKIRLADCRSFREQLTVYLDEFVVIPYEVINADLGSRDFWKSCNVLRHPSVQSAEQEHYQFLTELLLPYTTNLGRAGQSPAQMARYMLFNFTSLRLSNLDRSGFDAMLDTFKATILATTTGLDQRDNGYSGASADPSGGRLFG